MHHICVCVHLIDFYSSFPSNVFISVFSFPQLGIQCAKKKDVEDALKLRREINVDPYQSEKFWQVQFCAEYG